MLGQGEQSAARVRCARAYAGLSQPELAARLDVHTATIRRWESGRQELRIDQMYAVADACEVPRQFMAHGWDALKREPRLDRLADALDRLADEVRAGREQH